MIIAITGTPGIGKTTVSKIVAKTLKAKLIRLSSLKVRKTYDKERKTFAVDANDLRKAAKKIIDPKKHNVIDGHLSHLMKPDLTVVLRCRPDVLEKRMKSKKWSKKKISENIHAEILDAVTIEAMQSCKEVAEIDSTSKKPAKLAWIIVLLVQNKKLGKKYRPGKIDWSERFAKYMARTSNSF